MQFVNVPIEDNKAVAVDITETIEVFKFGAEKHKSKGFENGTVSVSQHFYALLRHLWRWFLRFEYDGETGRSHLDHAHARLLMLIHQRNKDMNDDRPV